MRATPRTAATVLAVAVLAAAVLVAGTSDDQPPAPAGPIRLWPVSPPTESGMDYGDPTTVCVRFADAVHRRDTRTDAGPTDAYRRAMAYATGDLAAAVAAQPPGRDPDWVAWRAHRAATDPTVSPTAAGGDVRPADTTVGAHRAARVVFTAVGVDGWRGPTQRRLVLCTLRRDVGGWRVDRYDIVDLAGTP